MLTAKIHFSRLCFENVLNVTFSSSAFIIILLNDFQNLIIVIDCWEISKVYQIKLSNMSLKLTFDIETLQ